MLFDMRRAKPRYKANRNQWVIYHDGRDRYLCAGRANESLAWARAAELIGPDPCAAPPRTVVAVTAMWLAQRNTRWNRNVTSHWLRWVRGRNLVDVHAGYLTDYLAHLRTLTYSNGKHQGPYSPQSIRHYMTAARSVLTWAHAHGYLTRPVPPMPRLPASPEVDRSLQPDQLQAVIDALPTRARRVLVFQLSTGARIQEAALLRYDEIAGNVATLHRGKTYSRTGKPRVLALTALARQMIAEADTTTGYVFLSRLGKPYSASGLTNIIRRAGASVGLHLTGAYQLRHSWAQIRLDRGDMTLDELGEALGHRPGSKATRHYARISRERVLAKLQSLADVVTLDPQPERDQGRAGG